MRFADFAGNGEMLEQIMRSAKAGRIVHALLFVGGRGYGKRTAAQMFVRGLYCSGSEPPCGECPSCKRVREGTHPDVHILKPEGKSILVDQVRTLIEDISVMPYEGQMHTVIIEHADRMNESAQNSLLKTLENPEVPTIFFLLAETVDGLLPTILSRCQIVRFRALTAAECSGVLQRGGMDGKRAEMLAGMSGGSVGRALEMDQDESFLALKDDVLRSLKSLKGPGSVAAAAAPLLAKERKDRIPDILEIMEIIARDRMALENGGVPFETDANAALKGIRPSGSALLKEIMELRQRLNSNVTWQNALETMFLRLAAF